MHTVVERFKQTYAQLSAQSQGLLSELYSDDVEFQDPFQQIAGLPAFRQYFADLYAQAESCSFKFEEDVTQGNDSVLMWTMFLKHPRLNGGGW